MADSKKPTRAEFTYKALIDHFPAPGGDGAHQALFKAGALGFKAKFDEQRIIADVKANIPRPPKAGREPSDAEIEQGVKAGFAKAMAESLGLDKPGESGKVPENLRTRDVSAEVFKRIVVANAGVTAEDIAAKSPVPLDFPEWEAGWRTLDALFAPGDLLFVGPRGDTSLVKPVSEWVDIMRKRPPQHPHVIPNPLSGEFAPTKSDVSKMTRRGDNCVVKHMHAVAEMDKAPLAEQLAFWSWAALPVRALILSAGKSIHAWVDVDCADAAEWEREVSGVLFPKFLVPLGCDPSCRNRSRLSRMPGYTRPADSKSPGGMQRLIWLSPEGKAVCE